MTLVILAHFLHMRIKRRLADNPPALILPQIVLLLRSVLPKPDFDVEFALDIVRYRQRRNHQAHHSLIANDDSNNLEQLPKSRCSIRDK